jgi:GTP-binding protein Era
MKSGIVALIGRPNTGKSTLINALVGQKVSITSPKPQTTRYAIQAVYEDERGQIIFIDTPGIFGKTEDLLSRKINPRAEDVVTGGVDVVVYLVDHTRERSYEENKTLGIVRKTTAPKILAFNKSDVSKPDFRIQYKFMEEEFDRVIEISAMSHANLNKLLDLIFEFLPVGKPMVDTSKLTQPGLNIDSRTFVAELIREKAFIFLRRELPYSVTVVVDDIDNRENGTMYVKARILTNTEKYKGMIVGHGGSMIKEISMATRKELETATNRKVYVDLIVETDPHWMDYV